MHAEKCFGAQKLAQKDPAARKIFRNSAILLGAIEWKEAGKFFQCHTVDSRYRELPREPREIFNKVNVRNSRRFLARVFSNRIKEKLRDSRSSI